MRGWPPSARIVTVVLLLANIGLWFWDRRPGWPREDGRPSREGRPPGASVAPGKGEAPPGSGFPVVVRRPGKKVLGPRTREEHRAFEMAQAEERMAIDALVKKDYAGSLPHLEKAVDLYGKADALGEARSSVHYELVVALMQTGHPEGAVSRARGWLEDFPDDVDHLEILGKLEYLESDFRAAAEHLGRAAALRPDSAALWRQCAEASMKTGLRDQAIGAIERALQLDPTGERTLWLALETYYHFKRFERASEFVEKLRPSQPDNPHLLIASGTIHRRLGHFQRAEGELRQVLGHPSYGEDARFELGLVIAKQNRPAEAVPILGGLLESNPFYAPAYVHLFQALVRLGRTEAARIVRPAFDSLEDSEREYVRSEEFRLAGLILDAELSLARCEVQRLQIRRAEKRLRDLAEKHPGDPRARLELARLLLVSLRAREAEELLLEAGSADGRAALDLGAALEAQGKTQDVLAHYERIAEDPGLRVDALARAGFVALEDAGDPERAKRFFGSALREKPNQAIARVGMAQALFALGDHEGARNSLDGLPDTIGAFEVPILWRARCAARLGEVKAAEEMLARVPRYATGTSLYRRTRAEVLEANGDPGAANERLQTAQLESRDGRVKDLRREVSLLSWPEAARLLLELARSCADVSDAEASRYARLAAEAAEGETERVEAHRLVARHLVYTPFAFQRLFYARRWSDLAPGDPEASQLLRSLRERLGITEPGR